MKWKQINENNKMAKLEQGKNLIKNYDHWVFYSFHIFDFGSSQLLNQRSLGTLHFSEKQPWRRYKKTTLEFLASKHTIIERKKNLY